MPPELPKPTDVAIPLFVIMVLVELAIVRLSRHRDYEAKDTTASLMMGVGNVATDAVFGFISVAMLMYAWSITPLDLGWNWGVVAVCFVLDDFRFYWSHRISHVCRWFWGAHVVHHSSQHYNLSTALRQPWNGHLTGLTLLQVPMVLIGFHPAIILFCGALNLVYQFWIHTQFIDRLPRVIAWVFNTPSHHRVHHATNPRYLDANFAGTFILWDRLFQTFVPEQDSDPPQYGLVHNIGTFNPARIATHEWMTLFRDATRRGLKWSERMGYIFGPPGYSHDGQRKTSRMIQENEIRRKPDLVGTPGFPAHRFPSI